MGSKRKKHGNGSVPNKNQRNVTHNVAADGSTQLQNLTQNAVTSSKCVCNDVHGKRESGTGWRVFERQEDSVFPTMTPLVVVCVTLAVRVCYVIDPKTWWVLHPDEVFQSMEVAHSRVYGYGFRPFEYMAPHRGSNLSHYQQREMMLGMYALRSPIVPHVYAIVAAVVSWTGWEGSPFMIWRIWHVFVTSALPLAVYVYVKATGKPHDVASVSSILTAASSHLNVFGTHTIINSFVSPFLFLSLSRVFSVLEKTANSKLSCGQKCLGLKETKQGKVCDLHTNDPMTHDLNTNDPNTNGLLYDLKPKTDNIVNSQDDVSMTQIKRLPKSGGENIDMKLYENKNCSLEKRSQARPGEDNSNIKLYRTGTSLSANTSETNVLFADMMSVKSDQLFRQGADLQREHSFSKDSGKGESIKSGSESSNNMIEYDENNKNNDGDNDNINNANDKLFNEITSHEDNDIKDEVFKYNNKAYNDDEVVCSVQKVPKPWRTKNVRFRESNIKSSIANKQTVDITKEIRGYSSSEKTESVSLLQYLGGNFGRNDVIDFCAGFGLFLCLYVRPDLSLLVTMLFLSHVRWSQISRQVASKSTWVIAYGGLSSLVFAVTEDFRFYQSLEVTPWRWLKFNVLFSMSSRLFGEMGSSFYVENVFFENMSVSFLSLLFILSAVVLLVTAILSLKRDLSSRLQFFKETGNVSSNSDKNNNIVDNKNVDYYTSGAQHHNLLSHFQCDPWHAFTVVAMATIYSCLGHKEQRFIHDVIVLYYVTIASTVTSLIYAVFHNIARRRVAFSIIFLLFSINQWQAMPSGRGSDVNQCLHYISKQNDVTGVFLDSDYPYTFSFSILHKDVPLLTSLDRDYLEFNKHSNTTHQSCLKYGAGKSCRVRFFHLNAISNLIHTLNTESLLKTIIESTSYNIAILDRSSLSTTLLHKAFRPVFRTDSAVVWRRNFKPDQEKVLWSISSRIPAGGRNVTLMEYEGEVLKQLGNYHLCVSRLKAVLSRPGGVKVKVMASLAFCLHRLGRVKESAKMAEECSGKFDKKACLSGAKIRVFQRGRFVE